MEFFYGVEDYLSGSKYLFGSMKLSISHFCLRMICWLNLLAEREIIMSCQFNKDFQVQRQERPACAWWWASLHVVLSSFINVLQFPCTKKKKTLDISWTFCFGCLIFRRFLLHLGQISDQIFGQICYLETLLNYGNKFLPTKHKLDWNNIL